MSREIDRNGDQRVYRANTAEQAAWDRTAPALSDLYPHLKPDLLLEAAEARGLGRRRHQLVEL